mmetsp:Transcript_23168/g.54166  ORF Transcript_23168/g.54166 Transcript_23168/m.54166 type:complete len:454 (+) Transcript_23168:117-1478(+)|eukprot:CAMPEP_0114562402 /NCGR_PEP_ID=MMETSP0114-20121206/12512_1 /TAXON_ID=31324 /ORGANISM="Goniomonas sp, Strain m" /LENGTH=453 /DNA_ID=CAMNT_0001748089 /DNA_START=37 /DNA_END=1398 /DNA_ORIENTATION=+
MAASTGKRKRESENGEGNLGKTARKVPFWLLESQDGGNDPDWMPLRIDQKSLLNNRYCVRDLLGRGTFGVVLQCEDTKKANKKVAVKISTGSTKQEYIHLKCAHAKQHPYRFEDPHILEPLGCFTLQATARPQQLYLATVTALHEGDLASLIDYSVPPALSEVFTLGNHLLTALAGVHAASMVHADVKPQNLLWSARSPPLTGFRFVLADFGSSFKNGPSDPDYMVTRQYRPPEVVLRLKHIAAPVDIWAAACVIAEYALGEPLFSAADTNEIVTKWVETIGIPDQLLIKACPVNERWFVWREDLQLYMHPPLGCLWSSRRSRKKRQDLFYCKVAEVNDPAKSQFERPEPKPSEIYPIRMQLARDAPGWTVRHSENVAPGALLYSHTTLGVTQWQFPRFRELRKLFERRYPGISSTEVGLELIDALTKMLKWDPSSRPTATQCLAFPCFSANA